MRIALLAGALLAALAASGPARADSILDLSRRARPRGRLCHARPHLRAGAGLAPRPVVQRDLSRRGPCAAAALARARNRRGRADRGDRGERSLRVRRKDRARRYGCASSASRLQAPRSAAATSGRSASPERRSSTRRARRLYLDAVVMRGDAPRHEVYALSLADGSVEPGWPVDVATALGGTLRSDARRTSAARSRCSAGGCSFPSAASPAIAASITGWSSAFRPRSPAMSSHSRPAREAGASGRRAA